MSFLSYRISFYTRIKPKIQRSQNMIIDTPKLLFLSQIIYPRRPYCGLPKSGGGLQ